MNDAPDNNTNITALRNTGLQNLQAGQFTAALHVFEHVLRHQKHDAVSWAGLGSAHESLGDLEKAKLAYGNALKLEPNAFTSAHHFGRVLLKLGEYDAAASHLTKATDLNPASEAALCDLGSAQLAAKNYWVAEETLQRALLLRHNFLPALINLGRCYREQLKPDRALEVFESTLRYHANSVNAVTSLASTLSDMGRVDDAITALDKFLANNGDEVECRQTRALTLLRAGQLDEGFKDYEWRLYPGPTGIATRPFTVPRWSGDDLGDRTLLLWLEQGIGDEILSLSLWTPQLTSSKASQHIVECDPRLTTLISRSYPQIQVVPRQDPPADICRNADVSCPAWSGGRYFASSLPNRPSPRSYLSADREKTDAFKHKYEELAQGRKIVGLSWCSAARHGHLKTPPLEAWQPLVSDPSLFMICLQYNATASDLKALSDMAGRNIYVDPSFDPMTDLDGSAAQLSALDTALTVSNSTAHLAGALGVPVATVIPSGYGGFWYWFRDRSDSPWYRSMQLFRQDRPGHWEQALINAHTWIKESKPLQADLPSQRA